jgi:guanylate kinase
MHGVNGERRLFVVAAPSGAGKTSLVKALLAAEPGVRVCVSHTTRRQRPSEQHERDYYFVTPEQFHAIREADGFLESANVFDNWYGTSRLALERAFGAGFDVVLEIDWQGARQVRARLPSCVSIFILPPSRAELEKRLRTRRTDPDDVIARRLRDAVSDMTHFEEFDYVVVNDDFDQAVADLRRIVAGPAPALASDRPELVPLLKDLLGNALPRD